MMRRMRATAVAVLACVSLALLAPHNPSTLVAAAIDPNDKGEPLFPDGHPNITYFTDDNWDTIMDANTDKPWLVDFYHPFCPHCKQFAPAFFEIAAYYKALGNIHVGAISCMDWVKCRRVGITGFPTLITLNFDKTRPKLENKRVIGTHTIQEVKDYVNSIFLEAKINETGTLPPNATLSGSLRGNASTNTDAQLLPTASEQPALQPGEELRKELWEESTLPMNQTTRLQDAASAFVFGLKQGVFMGREVLEDAELDALKNWLSMVAQTFPGTNNRVVIHNLATQTQSIQLLDFDTWDALVSNWQHASVELFDAAEAAYNWTAAADVVVPEWQRVSNLFTGQGVAYRACALYTCGQWNMFHMLTMNPVDTTASKRSDALLVSVIASIRRFVKHFFGCVQCRDHFLEYNTLARVQSVAEAANKPQALQRWLWEMHNAVNTRILHPQWPKPDVCPTCGHADNWELVEVDKWLRRTYAYREVDVPRKTLAPVVTTTTTSKEPALRKVDELVDSGAPTKELKKPLKTHVSGPKDAELGIANHANTKELVQHQPTVAVVLGNNANAKVQSVESVRAPPVTLFAWYFVPVFAVGAYLLFVRSRRAAATKPPRGYHRPGSN